LAYSASCFSTVSPCSNSYIRVATISLKNINIMPLSRPMTPMLNRRSFIIASGLTALASTRALGANDTIRVGVIGAGGRMHGLLDSADKAGPYQIVAVSDVYTPHRDEVKERSGGTATTHLDYREVLEKDIDAVIIAAGTSSLDPVNFAGQICRRKARVVVVGAVPTGFDRENYATERMEATSADGTTIPATSTLTRQSRLSGSTSKLAFVVSVTDRIATNHVPVDRIVQSRSRTSA